MDISRRTLLAASSASLLASRVFAQEAKENKEPEGASFAEFTPGSEKAVKKGDEWLLKTMSSNGGCGVDIGQQPDIGCTAMVGLAMMAQGNTPIEGHRSTQIRKIVNYLLSRV